MKPNIILKIQQHILRNLHCYCISISIISFVFICVDEKLIPGFVPCLSWVNPDGVNGVVSVIGCSFIAGYIFYLLTCTIPNQVRRMELNPLLLYHFKGLESETFVCNEPIVKLQDLIKDKNDDEVYRPEDKEFEEIHHQIKRLDEEAKPLVLKSIEPINRYFTYLTPNQQKEIENIYNSTLFRLSNYLNNKQQISILEVKIMISHYDDLKQCSEKLLECKPPVKCILQSL